MRLRLFSKTHREWYWTLQRTCISLTQGIIWSAKFLQQVKFNSFVPFDGTYIFCICWFYVTTHLSVGVVSTVAGKVYSGFTDGTGTNAQFHGPTCLTLDDQNNLFIADASNHAIRKITPSGKHYLFVCMLFQWLIWSSPMLIYCVRFAGVVTTVAGHPGTATSGYLNGIGTSTLFNYPAGVYYTANILYIADSINHRIRTMDVTSGMNILHFSFTCVCFYYAFLALVLHGVLVYLHSFTYSSVLFCSQVR